MLPLWELALHLLVSLGFHFRSFYEVYKVSREHEEELDQEFELETDALFGGLKKDPTDFEWSFWLEWGKRRLVWLFLGHAAVSQLATLLTKKHRPKIVMIYGMWACWCVLGAPGVVMVLLHATIAFCVAQFRSMLLSWLCSLLLLSTLRLQSVEEVKRRWYKTENEYYLLQFSLTVRCLYYTSFSLELCRQPPSAQRASYSFLWLLTYVFYYPVFHNGPILTFPEFFRQMQQPELSSLQHSLCILAKGLGRLLCWWWLAELMIHLMYMHALYSSIPLLESVSCWTLGGLALAQVLFFYVKYLVLFGAPALLMRLDGLTPPPLPRCVSTMFSFTGMWRYFDVGLHNFLIRFLQAACQIHNGHIGGRNTEGHASELPVQLWDDLAHSLGSTSGCRDDVLGSPTTITPQLSRGAIHSLLSGSDGMDCGHEPFHDAKVVMDDLGQGG
ncbi:protein-cysteine N-palmitoyltransferase HHAT isoform X2 [Arvicanthis niloticus]|uniref:protein-cysteine N-palmitoyltransferase HHAT isoform X2 n=1 Tax=Arvicanthis niloticus TaxID=61156 RepID=UPI00402B94D6